MAGEADSKMTRRRHIIGARRGQAVVEFALVLPIFMLMLMAAVEFGRAYFCIHLMTNAARTGSRAGALAGSAVEDVTDAVDIFLEEAGMAADSWTTTVRVTDSEGEERAGGLADAQQGDRVAVTVSHDFEVLSGSMIPGWGGTVELSSNCVFRHE